MSKKRQYEINIPNILKIEKGILGRIGEVLKAEGLDEVIFLFGNDLTDMFGEKVFISCEKNMVEVLSYQEMDSVNMEDLSSMAFTLSNRAKAIVGIGGGKVIDGAKYISFLRQLPFISVPTSSSSDGFASASASLLVKGKRVSVPAVLAYGILVDIDVIRSAPDKFIYSGIGDMISKITANYDWKYESVNGYGCIDEFAVMVAKKAVNSFARMPMNDIHDDGFLKEMLDSLAMSGIANEIAGGSTPTSGSEHLISHALDKIGEQPQLHGIQVGIATYIMALVQNHRQERVRKVLSETGFFNYCKTLNLSKELWIRAINMAPDIKPYRHTYLHEEKYRQMAIELLSTDDILKKIFND